MERTKPPRPPRLHWAERWPCVWSRQWAALGPAQGKQDALGGPGFWGLAGGLAGERGVSTSDGKACLYCTVVTAARCDCRSLNCIDCLVG